MPLGPRDTFPFVPQSRPRLASERSLFFNLQVGSYGVCLRFVRQRVIQYRTANDIRIDCCSLCRALSSPSKRR